jgi:hypothetical protein
MNDTEKLNKVKEILLEAIEKEGHERCWYHPDLFQKLIDLLEIKTAKNLCLPPRKEFEQGCKNYQEEQYQNEQNL